MAPRKTEGLSRAKRGWLSVLHGKRRPGTAQKRLCGDAPRAASPVHTRSSAGPRGTGTRVRPGSQANRMRRGCMPWDLGPESTPRRAIARRSIGGPEPGFRARRLSLALSQAPAARASSTSASVFAAFRESRMVTARRPGQNALPSRASPFPAPSRCPRPSRRSPLWRAAQSSGLYRCVREPAREPVGLVLVPPVGVRRESGPVPCPWIGGPP